MKGASEIVRQSAEEACVVKTKLTPGQRCDLLAYCSKYEAGVYEGRDDKGRKWVVKEVK